MTLTTATPGVMISPLDRDGTFEFTSDVLQDKNREITSQTLTQVDANKAHNAKAGEKRTKIKNEFETKKQETLKKHGGDIDSVAFKQDVRPFAVEKNKKLAKHPLVSINEEFKWTNSDKLKEILVDGESAFSLLFQKSLVAMKGQPSEGKSGKTAVYCGVYIICESAMYEEMTHSASLPYVVGGIREAEKKQFLQYLDPKNKDAYPRDTQWYRSIDVASEQGDVIPVKIFVDIQTKETNK